MYFCIINKNKSNYDNSNDRTDCTAYYFISITFTHSEAEEEGEEEMREAYEANGNKELNLKDLLARNSTKGYKAI